MSFFIEVLAGGLLAGVMYSLVALGFVLIYKASGVFNFAQGSLVFFAALTFVSLTERGWSFALALGVTLIAMVVLGVLIERIVLRPLITLSSTLMPLKSAMFWKVRAMPSEAARRGSMPRNSRPRKAILPFCGR